MEKVVLFDAVGTLIYPDPGVTEIYQQVGARHGAEQSPDEIKRRIRREVARVFDHSENRFVSSDEIEFNLWEQVVHSVFDTAETDLIRQAIFSELWEYFASPTSWTVFPDVKEAWKELVDAGIKIGIASNFDTRLLQVASRLAPLSSADFVICSAQVGFRKPSHDFYHAAERAILKDEHGFDAEARTRSVNFFMIGDDVTKDVIEPDRFGWQTAWIDRGESPVIADVPDQTFDLRTFHDLREFSRWVISA